MKLKNCWLHETSRLPMKRFGNGVKSLFRPMHEDSENAKAVWAMLYSSIKRSCKTITDISEGQWIKIEIPLMFLRSLDAIRKR